MNAIRLDASTAYQSRIDPVTQGNIRETFELLNTFKPERNEFVDALVNRIGEVIIKNMAWTNPLKELKRGMMQFGETVEDVFIDLIKAKSHDPNESYEDVWKRSTAPVYSNFHHINRESRYDLYLDDGFLNRAFLTDNGLSEFMSKYLEVPYTSDEYDEYLIMKNLFKEADLNDGFFKIQVPDSELAANQTYPQREYVARQITEKIRAWCSKLRFPSNLYNPMSVTTASPLGELCLFVTPEVNALLDVNVLAHAFNVSHAEVPSRVIEIDEFPIDGCVAILADLSWFVCMDTKFDFESIRNPKALGWNYFLHRHGVYSLSRFANCVMFTVEAGTTVPVANVTATAVNVNAPDAMESGNIGTPGNKYQFTASVSGTVTPTDSGLEVPQAVSWSVVSIMNLAEDTAYTPKDYIYIDEYGWLHISPNEEFDQPYIIKVSATSVLGGVVGEGQGLAGMLV
jgi:hypothetical protein